MNRFLITLKAHSSGNVWFFSSVRKQRHVVCGKFYVQGYHPSTELSHRSLGSREAREGLLSSLRVVRTLRFSWPFCEQAEERGRLQGELFRGGKGMACKGQAQQTPLRFSFISTVPSHTVSSLDFNNNERVLENESVFMGKNAKVHLVPYPWFSVL